MSGHQSGTKSDERLNPAPCGCSDSGKYEQKSVREALIRTFATMDAEIIADAARTGARCGSTACVALQIGCDLYVAHAGEHACLLA